MADSFDLEAIGQGVAHDARRSPYVGDDWPEWLRSLCAEIASRIRENKPPWKGMGPGQVLEVLRRAADAQGEELPLDLKWQAIRNYFERVEGLKLGKGRT